MIEKKLGCKIIRINQDIADFDIYRLINQIRMHIKQSTKKSLIDNLFKKTFMVRIYVKPFNKIKVFKMDC